MAATPHPTAPLDLDRARRHPALAGDLEYAALLPAHRSTLHLRREQERVARVLATGGWALGTPNALALVRPLPFDSEHFGLPCADLHRLYDVRADDDEVCLLVDAVVQRARRSGVALLSARPLATQTAVVQRLLDRRFLLVDTSVELGRRGRIGRARVPAGVQIRDATDADAAALRRVARTFVDNRFHRDPSIDHGRARALYARWADAARTGRHGRLKLVQVAGQVAGLCTYHPTPPGARPGIGRVGLVALHPRFRGKGLFRPLVSAAAAAAGGTDATVTSTQVTNAAALRAFARLGLLPFTTRHILHGWL